VVVVKQAFAKEEWRLMTESHLKTISIDKLRVGMYVHSVIHPKGQVQLLSKGVVRSDAQLAKIKSTHIQRVVIDESKGEVASASEHLEENEETAQLSLKQRQLLKQRAKPVGLDDELVRARKLHREGKVIQAELMQSVEKKQPFASSIPKAFTQQLVASIERNPNALLCLSQMHEKDDYLIEHSLNVAILLAHFARSLAMTEAEVQDLAYAGFLHDIGKIRVPDEILNKPGRLSDEEMAIMKTHVQHGIDALEESNIPKDIVFTVGQHHERLDGKGYPFGYSEQQITRHGRMLAIADMYDALTADRCYKEGMTTQQSLKILLEQTPDKLDAELLQAFIRCMGLFPVGSLVKLSNERLAMVVELGKTPTTPKVRMFYSLTGGHFTEPKEVDLGKDPRFTIEKAVLAAHYQIDFQRYFNETIVG